MTAAIYSNALLFGFVAAILATCFQYQRTGQLPRRFTTDTEIRQQVQMVIYNDDFPGYVLASFCYVTGIVFVSLSLLLSGLIITLACLDFFPQMQRR